MSIQIDTYSVTITSHTSFLDIIPEGQPVTFTAVAAILLVAAVTACYLPAIAEVRGSAPASGAMTGSLRSSGLARLAGLNGNG